MLYVIHSTCRLGESAFAAHSRQCSRGLLLKRLDLSTDLFHRFRDISLGILGNTENWVTARKTISAE